MPVKLNGATSGSVTIDAPAVAGTNTLTLPAVTDTLVGLAATQTLTGKTLTSPTLTSPTITGAVVSSMGSSVLTSATAQVQPASPSAVASIDFTSIPSWVKRITVMFSGISTSGTSNIQLQLGDAGGVETSGYNGAMSRMGAAAVATSQYPTTGFLLVNDLLAADVLSGVFILPLIGSNIWCGAHQLAEHASTAVFSGSGTKTLSDTLTQIRITTVGGTDTFDAGTINILYE